MQNNIPLLLTFDDVLLEPRYSEIHRSGTDVSTRVTKHVQLAIPVLSAAMDTVSETEMAVGLGKLGGMAVIHRNLPPEQQADMVRAAKKEKVIVGAAVGAVDVDRAIILDKAGADVVVLDCAHAHVKQVIAAAKSMKKKIRADLMVGNIATAEAARALCGFADGIKVGVGPGSICTTRVVAGVGVPQLTAILECVKEAKKKNVPVVADGGIKYSGDAVKALAAGASCVMLGSMLAGTKETPGEVIKLHGKLVKMYRGMGSIGAMKKSHSSDRYFQKNEKQYVPEGIEGLVPYKGHLEDLIFQLIGGIRSGMGYIGARRLADMPKQARFVRITNAGLTESHPHTVTISESAPNY